MSQLLKEENIEPERTIGLQDSSFIQPEEEQVQMARAKNKFCITGSEAKTNWSTLKERKNTLSENNSTFNVPQVIAKFLVYSILLILGHNRELSLYFDLICNESSLNFFIFICLTWNSKTFEYHFHVCI